MPRPDADNDSITVFKLDELKTFMPRDLADDKVLLRVRTPVFETWYRLRREDFIALANYLAAEAAQMTRDN
jgi:hypothetical protein